MNRATAVVPFRTARPAAPAYSHGMTREHIRLPLVAAWLLAAMTLGATHTPGTPAGWLTWCVIGVALPLALWFLTATRPVTMSQAIHQGRD